MYDQQQVFSDSLYVMVYGGSMVFALIACIYLLFRRSNAIAPEVTPPLRLRRRVAAFFAIMVISHLWWYVLVKYNFFGDLLSIIVAAGLDCVVLIPFILASLPIVVLFAMMIDSHDVGLLSWVRGYFMLMTIVIIIYMIFAVRQYSLWLRHNYADLEHKEVWQSFLILAFCLIVLSFYVYSSSGMTYEYVLQTFDYLLVVILLWRVETLQALDAPTTEADDLEGITAFASVAYSTNIPSNIGQLLEQYCEATQLYLQHDLKLDDFCRAVGTNRTYLSQHFTQHNTTYNAYINGLRIQHFVRLYREAVATNRSFTAQQLAQESGFRSYSTFAVAFKQRMGQTVMKWMRNAEK